MTTRTYELRVYSLASAAAQRAYATEYYPRHQVSLRELFDVTVHGYWSAQGSDSFDLYVLMSYPEDADPDTVRQQYRVHPAAAANMPGFDPSVILGVSITLLNPGVDSPLA